MLVPLGDGDGPREVRAADGRRFAVLPADGEVHVTDALCPHNAGPVAEGRIRNGRVHCPWHWYAFDLTTGACRTATQYRLGIYPVVERDGRRFADVGETPRARSWSERLRAHARGEQ